MRFTAVGFASAVVLGALIGFLGVRTEVAFAVLEADGRFSFIEKEN